MSCVLCTVSTFLSVDTSVRAALRFDADYVEDSLYPTPSDLDRYPLFHSRPQRNGHAQAGIQESEFYAEEIILFRMTNVRARNSAVRN